MPSDEEKQTAHEVLAHFFDRPVRDMGGGLRIVELPQKWMDAKWVDLIKKAVREYDRMDWLQGRVVDTIYLDDGKIIDVRGDDLREAIDKAMGRWPDSLEDEEGEQKLSEQTSSRVGR